MIEITTSNAHRLADSIKQKVEENLWAMWHIDSEGDYSLIDELWERKAWMTPVFDPDNPHILRYGIIGSSSYKMTKGVYGVYHGRFAEMLLTFFDTEIETLNISPLFVKDVDMVP